MHELREYERLQLNIQACHTASLSFCKLVIPTERVLCATEESGCLGLAEGQAGFGKGTASAMPKQERTSTALAAEVNKS